MVDCRECKYYKGGEWCKNPLKKFNHANMGECIEFKMKEVEEMKKCETCKYRSGNVIVDNTGEEIQRSKYCINPNWCFEYNQWKQKEEAKKIDYKKENEDLKEENEYLKEQLENLQENYNAYVSLEEHKDIVNKKITKENEDLKKEIEKLNLSYENMKYLLEETKKQLFEVERGAKDNIQKLKEENEDLLNTIDKQQKINNQLCSRKKDLEEELKEITKRWKKATKVIREKVEENKKWEKLFGKLYKFTKEKLEHIKKLENEKFFEQIENKADEEKKELKYNLMCANKQIDDLQEEIVRLTKLNKTYEEQNKSVIVSMGSKIKKLNENTDFNTLGIITIEEMGELTQAITKIMRSSNEFTTGIDYTTLIENLQEELADVIIMCNRFICYGEYEEKVFENINFKLDRTMQRMGIK